MPKQLTKDYFDAHAVDGFNQKLINEKKADQAALTALCNFVPPQTYQAWLEATDVAGKMSNRLFSTTKSRGATLARVDRAYKAWIEYGGAEGIMHPGNADSLRQELRLYRGGTSTSQLGAMSHNYRDERNKGNVMGQVQDLCDLIYALGPGPGAEDAEAKRMARKVMVTLIGNIGVDWDWKMAALGGLAIVPAINGVIETSGTKMAEEIAYIVEGSAAGAAAVGGGIYAGYEVSQMQKGSLKWVIYDFLAKQCKAFGEWVTDKVKALIGGDVQEILGLVTAALKIVIKFACKAAEEVVGGASDIAEGVVALVKDAWTRSTISAQALQLVTVDGAFAKLREGIRKGIAARQAVAGWTIIKGVITTTVDVVSAKSAGKIADLVLKGFEFVFKMIYNKLEIDAIKDFLKEAKTMFTYVHGAPTVPFRPEVPETSSAVSTGFMPAFRAAHYTADDFLNDRGAAYLNFLDSLIKSSPVMAAIAMNSGLITKESVLHWVTSRSTGDVAVTEQHVKTLKAEAVRLYTDSKFSVTPAPIAVLNTEQNAEFQRLVNNCKLATKPKVVSD